MASAPAIPQLSGALLYCDGLGERTVTADPATGELRQVLLLRHELGGARWFEFALRERTARLSNFRHASCAPVYRIDRVPSDPPRLAVVSAHVEGTRLSDLLRIAHEHQLQIDISAALCVIQQLASAVALLHGHASDVAHGLIAPERLVLSPSARLVIVEQVLAEAIEQMQRGRERLWRDLRIAAPPGAGPVCLDRNADLAGVGLVALAVLLGRPLQDDEFPARIGTLLDEARERTALGYERRLSQPLHDWIARLLQLESYDGFGSAAEACAAFEDVVVGDSHYMPAPIALEMFLSRCATALLDASAGGKQPAAVPKVPEAPSEGAVAPLLDAGMTLAVAGLREEPSEAAPSDEPDWTAVARQPADMATPLEIRDLLCAPDLPGLDDGLPLPVHEPSESMLPWSPASHGRLRRPRIRGAWQGWAARLNRLEFQRRGAAAAVMILVLCAGTLIARVVRGDAAASATASGTLVVNSTPAGLQVLVDGIDRGGTPARVPLRAGAHALEVRGGEPRHVEVDVPAGAEVSQHFEFAVPVMTGALRVDAQPEGGSDHDPVLQPEAGSSQHSPRIQAGETTTLNAPAARARVEEPEAPARGWLSVKAPFPVEIRSGGRKLGTSDGSRVGLAPGRHAIQLISAAFGYRESRVVQVLPGKVAAIAVDPPNGTVSINATPWAEVWIGGRRIGETPLANVSIPAGRHVMVLRHPQLGEKRRTVDVALGATVRVGVDMQ